MENAVIGWRERIALPELNIQQVTAKIDTGARTSCLHAFHIEPFEREGVQWVKFGVHPYQRDNNHEVWCESRVVDNRIVRSSTGQESRRYFIATSIEILHHVWDIEISLADRDSMGYRMLLGRTAVADRFMVNPGRSYLISRKKKQNRQRDT
jgi:hypothetical protein